jgi:Pentapeptide repeats (9 copies)
MSQQNFSNSPQKKLEIKDTNGDTLLIFFGEVAGGEDPESILSMTINSTPATIAEISDSNPIGLAQEKDSNSSIFSWSLIFNAGLIPTIVGIMTLVVTIFCNTNTVGKDQEKSIEERFLKTIELIGHDKINVRTGGIIILKQIFQESPDKKQESVELLANLIRINSPFPTYKEKIINNNAKNKKITPKNDNHVLADVAMALRIIKKTHREPAKTEGIGGITKEVYPSEAIDLTGVNLYNSDLSNGNLENISFNSSNFKEVNLDGANLKNSYLRNTNLKTTTMKNANLAKTNFQGSSIDDSKIKEACNWQHAIYDESARERLGIPSETEKREHLKTTEECRKVPIK